MANLIIIDDVIENVQVLTDMLSSEHNIWSFTNPGEALMAIEQHQDLVDMVLCDIDMPGLDGYDVLMHMMFSDHLKQIPLIFVSAYSDAEDIAKGLEMGAVDYVTKPVNEMILKSRMKVHLRYRELMR